MREGSVVPSTGGALRRVAASDLSSLFWCSRSSPRTSSPELSSALHRPLVPISLASSPPFQPLTSALLLWCPFVSLSLNWVRAVRPQASSLSVVVASLLCGLLTIPTSLHLYRPSSPSSCWTPPLPSTDGRRHCPASPQRGEQFPLFHSLHSVSGERRAVRGSTARLRTRRLNTVFAPSERLCG